MHTAVRMPARVEAGALSRRVVEWFANELGVDPHDAAVVATELVTNAVRHGAAPIVLHLRADNGSLLVEVTDRQPGDVAPRTRTAPEDGASGGLGLVLVAQLSRDWGVAQVPRGCKTVWARLETEPCEIGYDDDCAFAARGIVSREGARERLLAEHERRLAAGERKLKIQIGRDEPLDERAAELHRVAALMHESAAMVHDRVAMLADEQAQRLYDRNH